ncbi:hypothetical protein [Agrococcus sp. HG114]|uniref:hypothetical protein n=1 Tax=Agrococcus sp. HG114 TaxID=2969757 RepID=UPI00215A41BE|nr:hypothetical protein [Agrococcus sp. HG114]MCR8669929.1 hypothetical protein [Agrococcus sp. HG114]
MPAAVSAAPTATQQTSSQASEASLAHLEVSSPIGARDVARIAIPESTEFAGVRYQNAGLIGEHGVEFEFNLYNDDPAYSGVRPFCTLNGDPIGGYKDRFWARNYNWSWQGLSNTGNYAAAQPYADINDSSDLCTRQSIAIGLRYPRQLARGANSFADFNFVITAPRGLVASNRLGSVLQSVENVSCLRGGALTDCMGLSGEVKRDEGDATGAYITLNPSRGKTAPGTCWSNNDVSPYDGLPDAPYYFPCSHLGQG